MTGNGEFDGYAGDDADEEEEEIDRRTTRHSRAFRIGWRFAAQGWMMMNNHERRCDASPAPRNPWRAATLRRQRRCRGMSVQERTQVLRFARRAVPGVGRTRSSRSPRRSRRRFCFAATRRRGSSGAAGRRRRSLIHR